MEFDVKKAKTDIPWAELKKKCPLALKDLFHFFGHDGMTMKDIDEAIGVTSQNPKIRIPDHLAMSAIFWMTWNDYKLLDYFDKRGYHIHFLKGKEILMLAKNVMPENVLKEVKNLSADLSKCWLCHGTYKVNKNMLGLALPLPNTRNKALSAIAVPILCLINEELEGLKASRN